MGNTKIGTLNFNYSQFCPTYNSTGYIFAKVNADKLINNSPLFTYGEGLADPNYDAN